MNYFNNGDVPLSPLSCRPRRSRQTRYRDIRASVTFLPNFTEYTQSSWGTTGKRHSEEKQHDVDKGPYEVTNQWRQTYDSIIYGVLCWLQILINSKLIGLRELDLPKYLLNHIKPVESVHELWNWEAALVNMVSSHYHLHYLWTSNI